MRKLFLLILSVALFSGLSGNTVSETKPVLNANQVFLPVGSTGKKISVMELSQISLKDFESLTGRKMKLFEKASFKIGQNKLKRSINADGTFNKKSAEKLFSKMASGDGFHAGGFFLGLLLGLIGVLIAYLIRDDKKRNRVKWAWIGWAVWVAIVIIATVA